MPKPSPKHDAAKAETTDATTIEVPWRDLTFTVPVPSEWDVDVVEAIEDERHAAIARGLLGPEQWAQFKASDPKPKVRDIIELVNALSTATTGGSAGESEASSDS